MPEQMRSDNHWFIRINPAHLRGIRRGYYSIGPATDKIYLFFILGLLAFLASTFGAIGLWPQLPQIPSLVIAVIIFGIFAYALAYKTDYQLTDDPSRYPRLMKWSLKKEYR